MEIHSLLRLAEHEALKSIMLTGKVLDVGGDTRGEYRSLFQGAHSFVTINLDTKTVPDIFHDLEKPLPCTDEQFDGAVLMNVLEHIYEYRQLLNETCRVVKRGGTTVIVVPFLFPVHPSPHDFYRFTQETLERECAQAGFADIKVSPLGKGVFAARYVMLDRLLPKPIRVVSFFTLRYFTQLADMLWTNIAFILGKKYNPGHYALGYCVTARKL